jgi:hypothetical protein
MRLCCALVLLGIGGSLPGQVRQQVFEVADALGALEDKVGAVPGNVQPVDRLVRLLTNVLKREAKAAGQPNAAQVVVRRPRQQMLLVQGDRELCDLVQSVLDEMRREPLPRLHLTCTVLVMPWEIAAAHGLATNDVQAADMASMTKLMRDVVKVKGTLRNLPETIATPLVPFVAEPRVGGEGKPPPPKGAETVRLRGEAVAASSEEALLGVQLVRGNLPEDRTQLPKGAVFDRAFRLRVGDGVTITAKNGKTATVLWLRFTGTSTVAPRRRVV